ncbi:sensor histidine kinase [Frankia sp. AgB32]|uniref:sensor histidine kinase n=1 Tax=Frankia sp. AgB32 TaxID=631119 RepID=UPI00200DC30A|nr:ATP-binding protein [Frankia sp. AgB32]MCK9893414.1 histidine kinase [Frankia sp. AgB32]
MIADALTRSPGWDSLPLRVGGVSLLLTGLISLARPAAERVSVLMALCGASTFLGDLRYSSVPVLFAVGFWLSYLYAGLLGHLALSFPNGRLAVRVDRALAACGYLVAVGSQVAQYVVDHARYPWLDRWQENTTTDRAGSLAFCVVALAIGGRLIGRWRHASRPERRLSAATWALVVAGATAAVGGAVASATGAPALLRLVLLALFAITAGLLPIGLLLGVARVHLARGRTASFIVELRDDPDPRHLRDAMARVLGDPSVDLAFRLLDGSGWVDITGQAFTPATAAASGRCLTPVRRRGQELAMLAHDAALARQRPLMDVVLAAAGLALDNARLYASLQSQLGQVRASRQRLIQATFEERHRIQRDLHDGAQQRLLAILVMLDSTRHALRVAAADDSVADAGVADAGRATGLGRATEMVSRAHRELEQAIGGLRDLAHGIYPSILVEQGLAAAVEMVIDHAPCPVVATVSAGRWPRDVEVNAYFVITEALANVYKHAAASYASVVVESRPGRLAVTITDDGCGGALLGAGVGLRNLHDRVAAVGGQVELRSPAGEGTQVAVTFPVGDAAVAPAVHTT